MMDVIPVLELEDDDGKTAVLNVSPVCAPSYFSMRELQSEMPAVTAYILEHCHDDPDEFYLCGGYCFSVPGQEVFAATQTLRAHFKWDWAFQTVRTSSVLDWDDFGGGGFRYKLIRQNGNIEVRHSRRGHCFTASEGDFLTAADAAVADMMSFKQLLERSLSDTGLSAVEMLSLRKELWQSPE